MIGKRVLILNRSWHILKFGRTSYQMEAMVTGNMFEFELCMCSNKNLHCVLNIHEGYLLETEIFVYFSVLLVCCYTVFVFYVLKLHVICICDSLSQLLIDSYKRINKSSLIFIFNLKNTLYENQSVWLSYG